MVEHIVTHICCLWTLGDDLVGTSLHSLLPLPLPLPLLRALAGKGDLVNHRIFIFLSPPLSLRGLGGVASRHVPWSQGTVDGGGGGRVGGVCQCCVGSRADIPGRGVIGKMCYSSKSYCGKWVWLSHLGVPLFLWQDHTHPMTTPTRARNRMATSTPRKALVPVQLLLLAAVVMVSPSGVADVVEDKWKINMSVCVCGVLLTAYHSSIGRLLIINRCTYTSTLKKRAHSVTTIKVGESSAL